MFDTVHVRTRCEQVKLWWCGMSSIHLGERVGPPMRGLAPLGSYSVVMDTGGFLHVRDGILIEWAERPLLDSNGVLLPVVGTSGEKEVWEPRRDPAYSSEERCSCRTSGRGMRSSYEPGEAELAARAKGKEIAALLRAELSGIEECQGPAWHSSASVSENAVSALSELAAVGDLTRTAQGALIHEALGVGTGRGRSEGPRWWSTIILASLERTPDNWSGTSALSWASTTLMEFLTREDARALVVGFAAKQAAAATAAAVPAEQEEREYPTAILLEDREESGMPMQLRRRTRPSRRGPRAARSGARSSSSSGLISWSFESRYDERELQDLAAAAVRHHGRGVLGVIPVALLGRNVAADELIKRELQARHPSLFSGLEECWVGYHLDEGTGTLDEWERSEYERLAEALAASM